ncbi:hypothetical protein [Nocardia gipuzkoensis]|uniref:hypothetical protein n=1 Tax=Nocardia gipuzkoensis TaxID=2749991 RepID=UPI0015EECF11|nr:hypothetical protein [Nocardia gipuzkoensis]
MSSSISGIIAWPVIGFVAAVLAGRWLLVRDTPVDKLLNQLFLWGLLSLLLYRCSPRRASGPTRGPSCYG